MLSPTNQILAVDSNTFNCWLGSLFYFILLNEWMNEYSSSQLVFKIFKQPNKQISKGMNEPNQDFKNCYE